MSELCLINISGEDRPGLTAEITGLLSEFDAEILDVGQSVIHNHLSLGILISLPGPTTLQELERRTERFPIAIRFSAVTLDSYDDWIGLQGRNRYILTLLARRIKASHIAVVANIVSANGLNIDNITRLSGRVPLARDDVSIKACIEFSLRGEPSESFRTSLVNASAKLDIDIAVQEDNIYRRHRRLVAFDMDSTLIDTEVIDVLAQQMGVGRAVAEITERAMRGEIDFSESLIQRVALLRGMEESQLQEVASGLPLMEGARHLIGTLNRLGYKTAILSGGFTYFGEVLKQKLGIDYVFANELEIKNHRLTGNVIPLLWMHSVRPNCWRRSPDVRIYHYSR